MGLDHERIDDAMIAPVERTVAFNRFGPTPPVSRPVSPVVISVPHAGRDYSPDLLARAAVPLDTLSRLEDRHADALARGLIAAGHAVLIARQPRAAIDLNRHERELDVDMLDGVPHGAGLHQSAKLRAGLGLVPRRLSGRTALWRGRLPWAEVERRITAYHRPYHAMLASMLAGARADFGQALLIDLHSMPPLLPGPSGLAPDIVLGDRFGRSATGRLTALASDFLMARGLRVAQNHPYSGGHLLDRHGDPDKGVHAIQIEVSRALYLDPDLRDPGSGLAAMQRVVDDLVSLLAEEVAPRFDIAAE